MQPQMLVGEVLSAVAARVGHATSGGVGGWLVTLTSLLVLLAVGGCAAGVLGRLTRSSTPELIVLLNRSAAFYRRWPEDQHLTAPRGELVAEATRCQRVIELLEHRAVTADDRSLAARGPIDGLHAWIALLNSHIEARGHVPSGPAYA
ncbi:hypothetical protein BH09ACT7_BH09ACT7_28090 [soil metagenome]